MHYFKTDHPSDQHQLLLYSRENSRHRGSGAAKHHEEYQSKKRAKLSKTWCGTAAGNGSNMLRPKCPRRRPHLLPGLRTLSVMHTSCEFLRQERTHHGTLHVRTSSPGPARWHFPKCERCLAPSPARDERGSSAETLASPDVPS